MSDKKNRKKSKSSENTLLLRLVGNNKVVFVVSLFIAVICWTGVSMFQATETEKTFSSIKVQLNLDDSMPVKNGLKLFGEADCFVDVTVKGKSYILNDPSFSDKITVSAMLSSVSSAGTYSIPLSSTINNIAFSDAEITFMSKNTLSLYFDEEIEKTFDLNIDINENDDGYSLPEGYVRENPRLSTDTVTLKGPSLEINRITAVNAVVELDKELKGTEEFDALIVPVGSNENASFPNVVPVETESVKVVIPINCISEFSSAVSFTGMPKSYKTDGVKYTVSPQKVKASVSTSDPELISSESIVIGSIDFSQLNNEVNYIKFSADELPYVFADEISGFTAIVDMSGLEKRWLEVPVSTENIKLPDGATLETKTIQSVQVIGPGNSVMPINSSEVLAVPVLDGVELKKGNNTVPVKITLRTLTDSWVRGEYTAVINVK